jgi:hypothetical protein
MAEVRFDAPTVQNLNVTGTLRVSGRQAVTKRLYCNFTTTENTSPGSITPVTPAGGGAATPAVSSRTGITPARLFDYETGAAFEIPSTASIRGFTVIGTSASDRAAIADLRAWAQVPRATATGVSGIALTLTRCPLPKDGVTDTVASRDPTPALTVVTVDAPADPAASPAALTAGTDPATQTRATGNSIVYATGDANPYAHYYKNLSPVTDGFRAYLNSHVGVCYEHADALLARTASGTRFDWSSPAASDGVVVKPALAANAGLSVAMTFIRSSGNVGFAAAPNTEVAQASVATNLGLDVLLELEYHEDATTQKRDAFATSRIADLA